MFHVFVALSCLILFHFGKWTEKPLDIWNLNQVHFSMGLT